MNPQGDEQRLSGIPTPWSLLDRLQAGPEEEAAAARDVLVLRYWPAVKRYLLGALRDEEAAHDLCNQFIERFLEGRFRHADPGRGRFRDYLKKALIHLVIDEMRRRNGAPGPLTTDVPAPPVCRDEDLDSSFEENWRGELIDRAWKSLAENYPNYHAVLLSCAEDPALTGSERAVGLSGRLGRKVSEKAVRVLKHRSKEKFARLLLDEVSRSLGTPTPEELVAELRELRLLSYCEPALMP
jgi:DNA-directed RNA polymerase specialized sigma24 family protein